MSSDEEAILGITYVAHTKCLALITEGGTVNLFLDEIGPDAIGDHPLLAVAKDDGVASLDSSTPLTRRSASRLMQLRKQDADDDDALVLGKKAPGGEADDVFTDGEAEDDADDGNDEDEEIGTRPAPKDLGPLEDFAGIAEEREMKPKRGQFGARKRGKGLSLFVPPLSSLHCCPLLLLLLLCSFSLLLSPCISAAAARDGWGR
jgi:hypothetical protein